MYIFIQNIKYILIQYIILPTNFICLGKNIFKAQIYIISLGYSIYFE